MSYIEREAVEKFIQEGLNNPNKDKAFGHDAIEIMAEVHYMPAADVAPVRHGRWIFDHMTGEWSYYSHCSECNHQEFFANEDVEKRHKYCLNCGARMDKEDEHEAN